MVVDSGASGELVIKIPTTRSTSGLRIPPGVNNRSAHSTTAISETEPLIDSSKQTASPVGFKRKNADGVTVCCACSAAAMALSILTVIALCAAIYVRLDSTLTSVEEQVSPHASTMLQSTVSILLNTKNATDSLSNMGKNTDTLVKTSVPRLVSMLNSTQAMVERIQQFARKPSISIGPTAFLSTGS